MRRCPLGRKLALSYGSTFDAAREKRIMLTVAVLLSGPHRLGMLETAFSSIPIDSPSVSEVLIRHQGGPWNWGGELRERITAHPKVRVVEFPDRVDFAPSFNRTLEAIQTPWAMILPDDDYLVRPAAKAGFEAVAAHPLSADCGFVAFGWYYLRYDRYLASYVKRRDLASVIHYTPKFCSTLLNLRRVRELGGFAGNVGGLLDTALLGRLAYEFDALIARTPVGVYRLHDGQESAQKLPLAHAEALREWLAGYARTPDERDGFERRLAEAIAPSSSRAQELFSWLTYRARCRRQPREVADRISFRQWLVD